MKRICSLTMLMVLTTLMAGRSALGVKAFPLPEQEQATRGANWVVVLDHADLTQTTNNTAQTIQIFPVAAKLGVEVVGMILGEAYDTGNTNYTGSCAVTVGDGTDADLFLTSTELASDGTEVFAKYGRGAWLTASTKAAYTNHSTTTANAVTGVTATTSALFMTNATTVTRNFATNVTGATSGTFATNVTGATGAFLTGLTLQYGYPVIDFKTSAVAYVTNIVSATANAINALTVERRTGVTGVTFDTAAAVTAVAAERGTAATGVTPATTSVLKTFTAVTGTFMTADALSFGAKVYTTTDTVDATFTPNAQEALADNSSGQVLIYLKVWKQ